MMTAWRLSIRLNWKFYYLITNKLRDLPQMVFLSKENKPQQICKGWLVTSEKSIHLNWVLRERQNQCTMTISLVKCLFPEIKSPGYLLNSYSINAHYLTEDHKYFNDLYSCSVLLAESTTQTFIEYPGSHSFCPLWVIFHWRKLVFLSTDQIMRAIKLALYKAFRVK